MPVIGTAGHVDHGKSTLVRALTGRDPDRWEEEKRRGLTIDLGFAWTTLDGIEVSFVDVPGHERFIKNMLAGTEGMDLGLLVVAADEGWMPQSEEHLAVLDLLGIDRGVVAVTKADRVDPEHLQLVMLDVEDRLSGTSLEGAPIVVTSVPEERGLSDLRAALGQTVSELPVPRLTDRPRMWIDRAFTIAGAGTVVTGTLTDGSLEVGLGVEIHPGPRVGRIRSLQSHEQDRREVEPRSRVAANLAGVERERVGRGMMLAPRGQWVLSTRIVAALRTVRGLSDPLSGRGAYHLHLGTGAWPARVRFLDSRTLSDTGAALIEVPSAIPVAVGDRLVLREVGRRAVVAGGRVLDPGAPARTRTARSVVRSLRSILELSRDQQATLLLDLRGEASLSDLAAQTRAGRPEAALVAGDRALSGRALATLQASARSKVEEFHRLNPLRPGIPKASLASGLGIGSDLLQALVRKTPELREAGADVAAAGFEGSLSDEQEAVWEAVRQRLEAMGLAVPTIAQLQMDPDLLHALVRAGRVVRVSEDFVYTPEQVKSLQAELSALAEPFTVAEFRDHFGISRKYAVPLLEWLDTKGVTSRRGDLRTLRQS